VAVKPFATLDHPLSGVNVIEASAGTGKTFTITTLFLRLLLEHRLRVGEILVVTYTNAATAELRSRLRSRLSAALALFQGPLPSDADDTLVELLARRRAAGDLEEDRRRLTAALYSFDDAAVFTIHGFCQRTLQEHAFESGAPFEARLITDQRALVREIVRDFWVRRLHDAPHDFVAHVQGIYKCLPDLTGLALRAAALRDVPVLPESREPLPPDAPHADRLLRLRLDLVEHAREELQRRKEEANIQDYDDLLTRLRDGLRRPAGALLAAQIRRRHPAALIDEFQDTDAVQYDIFRTVYRDAEAPLFLIGDPKQAIYSFRGADVYTYVDAKTDAGADRQRTLGVNRRSEPRLVAAVNAIFAGAEQPFVLDGIGFERAVAADDAPEPLGGAYAGRAPLQILHLPSTNGKVINKGDGALDVARRIAAEIARLLAAGATIGDRPVRANDIAVLCRTNKEARQVQAQLRRLRIPSVLQTDESVLETLEAKELGRILAAMAEPGDSSAILAALATPTLGVAAAEIDALRNGGVGWDAWTALFHGFHALWLEAGFLPAFRLLLRECNVANRVLADVDGERRLTNLLHLAEILHNTAAESHRGPLALAQWYGEVCTDAEARADAIADLAQIRLESDDLALKLATIHRSKGLEYGIVFCPFLWDGRLLKGSDDKELRFHDPERGDRLTLDIGVPADPGHLAIAKREALGEGLRLLYVALTRARHRCVVVWGRFKEAETSPLAYILHQPPPAKARTIAERIAATVERFKSLDDAAIVADLERIATAAGGVIEIAELSDAAAPEVRPREVVQTDIDCREAQRALRLRWRTSSFSALIAGGQRLSHAAEEGVDRDEADEGSPELRAPAAGRAVTLADFPAGTRAGLLLHSIFENIDFQGTEGALGETIDACLAEHGFGAELRTPLLRAIPEILGTPLEAGDEPLQLAHVGRRARLDELEFLFPVREAAAGLPGVHSGDLGALFTRHARPGWETYIERLSHLGFPPLAGFLKGFIDMVFVHGGRWYLVDYKSNHLGPRSENYEARRLLGAMEQHHYFLQYHLYAVALHRYLKVRLARYDYETHFGGVYYLFLRGMSAAHPRLTGVFADRPPYDLVEGLSALLGGEER
jgi:exodeoxyribonuclease V beta subunit